MKFLILFGLLGTALCHGPRCTDGSRPLCSDGSRPQRPPRGQRGPPTCSDEGLPLTCPDGNPPLFKSPCENEALPVCDNGDSVVCGDGSALDTSGTSPPCDFTAGKPKCEDDSTPSCADGTPLRRRPHGFRGRRPQ